MPLNTLRQTLSAVHTASARRPLSLSLTLFLLAAGSGCQAHVHADDPGAAPQSPIASTTYRGRGVVKTITPSRTYINIDHEPIEGYMDAMAMFFPVPDTALISGLHVADSITFAIEVGEGGVTLLEASTRASVSTNP